MATTSVDTKMDTSDFVLVIDGFGVKNVGEQHAERLITCIKKYYPVSVDWARNGELYCAVILNYNYKQKNYTLSTPV